MISLIFLCPVFRTYCGPFRLERARTTREQARPLGSAVAQRAVVPALSSPCMMGDAMKHPRTRFPVPVSCDTVARSVFIGRRRQEAHALPLALFHRRGLPRLKAPGCNGHNRARYFLRLSPAAACAFGFSFSTRRIYGLSRSKSGSYSVL